MIVTFNLSDFPEQALAAYGMEARHPDEFLSHLFDEAPEAFLGALQEMVAQLKNPPRTLVQHLDVLRDQGLKGTVERLAARLPVSGKEQ